MAASIAGVSKLDFYSFGDQRFTESFRAALKVMRSQTVGWVWERILEFRSLNQNKGGNKNSKNYINILEYIAKGTHSSMATVLE